MPLFGGDDGAGLRKYRPLLTAVENEKGVLDVDTVKGCTMGMRAYPGTGCYGECYAAKIAARYGIDFTVSVSRKLTATNFAAVFDAVRNHPASWYRIGTAGDPCHDWDNTLSVCEALRGTGKTPVIITKHWVALSDDHLRRLRELAAVVNTSMSGLDSPAETKHRLKQMARLREFGVRSVCRVVTCDYGDSAWAMAARAKQEFLLSLAPVIDNPLRANTSHPLVVNGDIRLHRVDDAIGGGKMVSLHSRDVYLGRCAGCPDQCGAVAAPRSVARDDGQGSFGFANE